MKRCYKYLILVVMAVILLGTIVSAEKDKEMIPSGYPDSEILVFPEPSIGSNGDIIKFVVFNTEEIPKVSLDIGSEIVEALEVKKITFEPEKRFFGWFDMPEGELYTIWINDNPIVWKDIR